MPRNGSGTYNLPAGNPVVPGTVISSSGWANPTLNDIAAALTGSWALNGEGIPTANQSLGNFRFTNVANALNRNEFPSYGQVQDGQPQWMTVSGTDTIIGTIAPGPAGYVAGQTFRFVAAGANTTSSPTLNINSLGAKTITKNGTQPLAIGEIVSGQTVELTYDGTRFQLSAGSSSGRLIGSPQVFDANGTYTPTAGMAYVIVEVQGGGGGGGGTPVTGAGLFGIGSGGSSGSYGVARLTAAQVGASQVITIGVGGSVTLGGAGGNGGQSSFGALVIAPGGIGGAVSTPTTAPYIQAPANPAAAASGTGLIFAAPGNPGVTGIAVTGFAMSGAGGGSPMFRGAGGGPWTPVVSNGLPGTTRGSGGGGCAQGGTGAALQGGVGIAGRVIVWEYS